MTEPIFDHERLDVYRLSIEYVAIFLWHRKALTDATDRLAINGYVCPIDPLNIAEGNGKQSLKDKNRFFEIARGSALKCIDS